MDNIVSEFEQEFHDDFQFDEIEETPEFNELCEEINNEVISFIDTLPENTNAKFSLPSNKIENKVSAVFISTGKVRMDHLDKLKEIKTTEGRSRDIIEKVNQYSIKLGTKIGVVFVGQDCADQNKILQIQYDETTPHFQEFITGLGWPIDLQKHVGYLGGLDSKNTKNGKTSIYYADAMHEMMFHIGPLIPTDPNDAQQIYKKRHIGNDHVHIVWCDGNKEYNTATITSQFNQAHIVIYPLQTALFRVDIFWRPELEWFGPLRHSVVVNKHALPSLVRETAEGAMLTFYQKQSPYAHPTTEIQGHIKTSSSDFLVDSTKFNPLLVMMTQNPTEQ